MVGENLCFSCSILEELKPAGIDFIEGVTIGRYFSETLSCLWGEEERGEEGSCFKFSPLGS